MDAANVCVVTVTYGNRAELVEQVVRAALELGVRKVVVIDNGSQPESQQRLQALQVEFGARLALVPLPRNTGSAGGFKAGLERAQADAECEFFWLIDDDNKPRPDSLAALLRAYERLRATRQHPIALHSMRPGYAARLRAGISIAGTFPRRSSFLEFDILGLPQRLISRIKKGRPAAAQSSAPGEIELPYAPYGGLFLHRSAIEIAGLPDERFFVYCDDKEFTYRFTKAGGRIYLVPESDLEDLEKSWGHEVKGPAVFTRHLLAESEFRVYYSVRNHAYFDRQHWLASRFMHGLNRAVYLGALAGFAWWYGKWSRFRLIRRAVREGEAGELGETWRVH